MTPKRDERKAVAYTGSNLNVTENVVKLVGLTLKELFGDIIETISKELMCWNNQTFSSLLKRDSLSGYKGKLGQQKISQALMILIKHNLVTFTRNSDDGLIPANLHIYS